jgi:hypothetical protein
MNKPGLRWCVLLPFAWLACDGSGSGAGGVPTLPGASGNATEFCNSFTQAAVSLLSHCYGGGEALLANLYAQVFNCTEVARLVSTGTLVYDATQGKRCLETIRTLDCGDTAGPVPACNAALTGTIPTGGVCAARALLAFSDCAPGNECAWVANSCGGTCRPLAQVGAPCGYAPGGDEYIDCEDGSTCDYQTEVCVAEPGEGQPCLGSSGVDCGSGLYCDGDYATAGVCRKQQTSGSCASDQECASTYVCVGSGDAGTCQKVKLPGDACQPGQCMPFFAWCGADGKCTDARATENQPCGSGSGDYIPCASGLYCDYSSTSDTGTCKRETPAGSPCTSSSLCEGTGYCDSTTQTCVSCR